jgi:Fe-S oxidoreductase/nitrate reductase gamma subunit
MPIRETFWNIPYWVEITQYILGFLAIGIFTYGMIRHVNRWRKGKGKLQTNKFGYRLMAVLKHGIGQFRLLQEPYAGLMHLTIFWGMFMLLVGTILATIDWEITRLLFGFQILKGSPYVIYELILDIFGILLLVGLGMAVYRRYIQQPPRLKNEGQHRLSLDDFYALGMLAAIGFTGFVIEGLRIAVTQPDWANWSPVGNWIAYILIGFGDPLNKNLHLLLWSFHGLIAFGFIASIPFTKLFHIVTVPLNIFFQNIEPPGRLAPAYYSSGPGIKSLEDLTKKQILDIEACTRCGRCQDQCPAFTSGLKLSPRNLMIHLGKELWKRGNGNHLYEETIRFSEVWACTTCRVCAQICPSFNDPISTLVDMRRYLVDEGQMDSMLQDALSNLARYGNSFGQSERRRPCWAQSFHTRIKDARKEAVEYLWFVGDYASYHPLIMPVTIKTAEVFSKAGMDFGILYEGERNAGNDVRRVGEEGLFEMLVEKNLASLGKCEFGSIITTDPHTYNTLKNEYPPELTDEHPILHYSELLDQLISSRRIQLTKKLDFTVTYQDPCYLSRYNNVYSSPRRVLSATGCKLVEMPRSLERSFCCGAGGGRIWMEEIDVKERPSELRVIEAAGLDDVNVLVVACPKDMAMFSDGVKNKGLENRLVVKDLIELVHEALEPEALQ